MWSSRLFEIEGVRFEMSDAIVIEHIGRTQVISINRPEARNAINPQAALTLKEAFEAGERNNDIAVHVLTGRGGTFCSGADLKAVSQAAAFSSTAPMGPTWLELSKPSIAAIEGHAVAGGLELSLICDMRIAAESAVFGVFCRRWGVPLIDGGTVRLPRLIGQSRALDMILTGRSVEASEALSFGLANRVVPDGTALKTALELAEQLASFPQECMRNDRLSSIRQWSLTEERALSLEAEIGRQSLSAGAVEGASRFAKGKGRGGDFSDI